MRGSLDLWLWLVQLTRCKALFPLEDKFSQNMAHTGSHIEIRNSVTAERIQECILHHPAKIRLKINALPDGDNIKVAGMAWNSFYLRSPYVGKRHTHTNTYIYCNLMFSLTIVSDLLFVHFFSFAWRDCKFSIALFDIWLDMTRGLVSMQDLVLCWPGSCNSPAGCWSKAGDPRLLEAITEWH